MGIFSATLRLEGGARGAGEDLLIPVDFGLPESIKLTTIH